MKRFLNLTSISINKSYIIEIIKKPSKYYIHINAKTIDGFMLFSSGSVSSNKYMIEVCEERDKEDFKVVKDLVG